MTGATPTERDKKLVHNLADRVWEWIKDIEDSYTRTEMKRLVSEMHALAEKK